MKKFLYAQHLNKKRIDFGQTNLYFISWNDIEFDFSRNAIGFQGSQ